jgi:hypothetical protein
MKIPNRAKHNCRTSGVEILVVYKHKSFGLNGLFGQNFNDKERIDIDFDPIDLTIKVCRGSEYSLCQMQAGCGRKNSICTGLFEELARKGLRFPVYFETEPLGSGWIGKIYQEK